MQRSDFQSVYIDNLFSRESIDGFFDIVQLVHNMIFVERNNQHNDRPYMQNPRVNEDLTYLNPLLNGHTKFSYVIDHDMKNSILGEEPLTVHFFIELYSFKDDSHNPIDVELKIFDSINSDEFLFMDSQNVIKENINSLTMRKYLEVWFNIPKTHESVLNFYHSFPYILRYYDSIPRLVSEKIDRMMCTDKEGPFNELMRTGHFGQMIYANLERAMYEIFYFPDGKICHESFL